MENLGKGFGTIGVWAAVAFVAQIEPVSIAFTGLYAIAATTLVWHSTR
jgi:hypothetical protein